MCKSKPPTSRVTITHAHEQHSVCVCVCRNGMAKITTQYQIEYIRKRYKITKKKTTTTNPTNSKRLYYVWQTIDQKVSGACTEKRDREGESKWHFSTFHQQQQQKNTMKRKSETSATSGGGYSFLIDFLWFLSTPRGHPVVAQRKVLARFSGPQLISVTTLDHWS